MTATKAATTTEATARPWHISGAGFREGREIFDGDTEVGIVKTREQASQIVRAVNSCDALVDALSPFAELGIDLSRAFCHNGLCEPEDCDRCKKVIAARTALAQADGGGEVA